MAELAELDAAFAATVAEINRHTKQAGKVHDCDECRANRRALCAIGMERHKITNPELYALMSKWDVT